MLSYFILGFFVGVTIPLLALKDPFLALKGWLTYHHCKALKKAHDESRDRPN
jgi:hypothetical protein